MREIKFRAFKKGVMYPVHTLDLFAHQNGKLCGFSHPIEKDCIDLEEAVFMQFTGLKDSKGNDLYEGDILLSPLGNVIEIIHGTRSYHADSELYECTGWLVRNKKGWTEFLDSTFCEGSVIGNIHQQPHLMQL